MAKRVSVDKWMFTVTLLLVFIGLVMVFSARPSWRGALRLAVRIPGAANGVGGGRLDRHGRNHERELQKFRRPTVGLHVLGITSLLLIAVFFFRDSHNTHAGSRSAASRCNHRGGKACAHLYLALFLETRWQHITDVKNVLLPAAAPTLLFCLLS